MLMVPLPALLMPPPLEVMGVTLSKAQLLLTTVPVIVMFAPTE